MNKLAMNDRLNILLKNKVISDNAYQISNDTFDFISEKYKKQALKDSEMFLTHMSMALTRIERGETVEGPLDVVMDEINQTHYKEDIEDIISYVNTQLKEGLPKEERDYFYLHLHRVIENNK